MKRFKNILLFADPTTDVTVSFRRALLLAKHNQAHLTVVDVVDQLPPDMLRLITVMNPIELQEIVVKERLSQLEKLVKPARKKGIRISAKVLIGTPFLEIIREALRHHHDLVIKSAEGKSTAKQLLFGSIDMHLMRKCPCPVWVIKSSKRIQYARILAAVDPDPLNEEAKELNTLIMDLATSLAMQERSELHIVHAWKPFIKSFLRPRTVWSQGGTDWAAISERKLHKEWLDKLLTNYSLEAIDHHVHLLKGNAGHIISKLANKKRVELLVMGTVARTGIPGFLIGNTAEMVLNQVNCSVLTVKPEGFVTPVHANGGP
jgi:nucleotide-binding universal stress UspA family protein